ncbi:MAG: hypothetical protein ACI8TX_003349 [Hyphomicrobiaceae bacterium]|jgi:hypothetical protein
MMITQKIVRTISFGSFRSSGFAAAAGLACLLGAAGADAQTFGVANPYSALRVAPGTPGAVAAHDLSVNLGEGEFEPLTIQIGYPLDFQFNGFVETAGANATVGALLLRNLPDQFYFNNDFEIRARSHDTAYADLNKDKEYTRGIDVLVTHSTLSNYQAVIMQFPFGGDADPGTLTNAADVRVAAHINEGVFTNPLVGGNFNVRTTLISVDPDTDNISDNAGAAPIQVQTQIPTAIGTSTLCAAAPSTVCRRSGKSVLIVKNSAKPGKDLLKWIFVKGGETTFAALGTPASSTNYALCIYDSTAALGETPAVFEIPADAGKWKAKDPKFVQYKDKAGTAAGVTVMKVLAGSLGKSKVKLIAKGANLVLPPPSSGTAFFNVGPNVQVQLFNSEGECWATEYTASKKNTAAKFIGKATN